MDPRLGEWVEGRGTGMEDLLVMVERRVEVGGDEEKQCPSRLSQHLKIWALLPWLSWLCRR
jgi:hypothetical protein